MEPVPPEDDPPVEEPKAKKAKTKETSSSHLTPHTGARPSRLKNDGAQWVDAYMEYAKGERVVAQNEEEQEEGEIQSWETVDWDTVRESVAREMLEQEALKSTDPSLRGTATITLPFSRCTGPRGNSTEVFFPVQRNQSPSLREAGIFSTRITNKISSKIARIFGESFRSLIQSFRHQNRHRKHRFHPSKPHRARSLRSRGSSKLAAVLEIRFGRSLTFIQISTLLDSTVVLMRSLW